MDGVNKSEIIKSYLSRFYDVFSSDFLSKLRQVSVFDGVLVSFLFRFDYQMDSNLLAETLRCACFYVFPEMIRKHGILVDDRGDGCVEIRFGLSEEGWADIAQAFRKPKDIR